MKQKLIFRENPQQPDFMFGFSRRVRLLILYPKKMDLGEFCLHHS